jgi:hypothetical protein
MLIATQVDDSINMNKYYVSVTSVFVLILIGGSLYFFAFVLRFKSRVLTFFAEIDRQSMRVSAQASWEFYKFLLDDSNETLENSKQILENHVQ